MQSPIETKTPCSHRMPHPLEARASEQSPPEAEQCHKSGAVSWLQTAAGRGGSRERFPSTPSDPAGPRTEGKLLRSSAAKLMRRISFPRISK